MDKQTDLIASMKDTKSFLLDAAVMLEEGTYKTQDLIEDLRIMADRMTKVLVVRAMPGEETVSNNYR